MKFEILVEGTSDKTTLWNLLPGVLGPRYQPHEWYIRKHQGVGTLPANPNDRFNPRDKTLLGQLPAKLKVYSKTLDQDAIVVLLVDLDNQDETAFRLQLDALVASIAPRPNVMICLAIEETEAWYLGDQKALFKAFPEARIRQPLIDAYIQDAPCNTWELLVRITLDKDPSSLCKRGRCEAGEFKCQLAKAISPHMDVEANLSPSFQAFRDLMRQTAGLPTPLTG